MKKLIPILLCCLMAGCLWTPALADEPLKVVTTNFPPYDFIRQIAGSNVDLTMLLKPGSESHSYEPTPQDMIAIQNSDLFIYTGGENDAWVDRILASMDAGTMTTLAMMDMVDTVEEALVEGMESDHEHSHEEEAFDPEKVYDRALSEWTGSWKSLAPYLEDGSLDEYVQVKADENEVSFDERMETQKRSWRTDDFNTFMVAGDKFYIDTGDTTYGGTYQNEGFTIIQRDDGSASVWYQYALADGDEGMPLYIVFNDHGYGTPPEGAETEAGHDDHGIAHTHLKYGDTSIEDVIAIEGWSTYYVDAVATNEQILATLLGHDSHEHDHAEFTLADIKDRALTDWEGDWQSVYPHLQDGTLDPVMEHKAESGEKTAQEYKEEYEAHYVTDIDRVVITANTMTFYKNDVPVTAEYTYRGTGVLEGSSGLWVRYKFEAINQPEGVPKYIMFSDHLHAPQKTEHFHIYASNTSFDELMADGNPVNYPTYYAMDLTKEELVAEMIGHNGDESHEHGEMDEHVWTSPRNAMEIVRVLTDTLCGLDSANAGAYQANASAYLADLEALDAALADAVAGAARKTIVVGDRFPFRYLTDAYGLEYFAAFSGCSTNTDASASTIAFLIDKVREGNIPVVFKIELSNGYIADTIAESTGAKVLEMHSAHNLIKADFDQEVTYLDVMWKNVEMLKEALQ